jgi:hypothetical protein
MMKTVLYYQYEPYNFFQTLIVWSRDPETMVFPSGEKSTDMTQWLWAFSLLAALSSRVPDGMSQFVNVVGE